MVDAAAAPIDRYVVLEYLSEGGMGAIYVGKKLGAGGFEKEVVLKQLLPEFTKQEEFIELFLREAKLSATLDHANIVHTIDLVNAGNEYFIVMEYLPGGDLRTLLRKAKRRGNRFSPGASIYIAREVLSALSYAHVKRDTDGTPLQLIHRDVSPSNVLLSKNGEVKLTDFGIAKAATHTSQFYKVKGKIGYMSPEQARSQDMDHRSDLYSLAVCFYEVLTGERLFIHAGLTTSADEIYSQPVPAVSRKVPGLPAEIDKIVWKSLMIDPKDRYQTAGEFQEALMRCAHRNGLLLSAPELAAHLREACGPIESWRDEDEEEIEESKRPATEIYDAAEEEEDDDFSSMQPGRRDKSLKMTVPELLQGIELTSIINNIVELMDESKSGREDLRATGGLPSRKVPSPAGSARAARPAASPASSVAPRSPSMSSTAPQRPGPGMSAARNTPQAPGLPVSTLPGVAPAGLSADGYPVVARAGSDEPAGILGPSPNKPAGGEPTGPPPQTPGFARMPTPPPVASPDVSGVVVPAPNQMGPGQMGAPYPAQPPSAYPSAYPAASPQHMPRVDSSGPMLAHSDEARRRKPWMYIAAVVLVGVIIAVIVGLSGPDIPADILPPEPVDPAPATPPTPAAPSAPAAAAK